jgi:DNA-binding NtrC family response regulator
MITRPHPVAKVVRERPKQPTAIEAKISSLKVLSLTLLAQVESLERQAVGDPDDLDLQAEVRRFEAELIRSALIQTGGRQRRAAQLLGMKVTTLNTKIRRYQITVEESPGDEENGSGTQEAFIKR